MFEQAIGKHIISTALLLFIGLGTACSHTASVQAFEPSSVRYPAGAQSLNASLTDGRPAEPAFSHGSQTIYVEFADSTNDELAYLQSALSAELSARGVPTKLTKGAGPGALRIQLRRFQIRNMRSSGFSPLVTFAAFSADVSNDSKTVRVVGYVKNSKMPVWSMGEVDRPCYSNALRVLVGEVATKINREFVGAVASDAEVARLEAAANDTDAAKAISATYELGFSNNPNAIAALSKLIKSDLELQRAAALSGLGVLGAVEQMDSLKDVYVNGKSTSDRYNALKAIGDLGTPEALAYLENAAAKADGREAPDLEELAALYLEQRPSPAAAVAQTTTAQ